VDSDFPFHLRDNPDFQASITIRDSNDIVGSQGVKLHTFRNIILGSAVDNGEPVLDTVFNVGGTIAGNTRRVTARNTPSTINAIFNFNNWTAGPASSA
jgi:hypothetical protein